MLRLRYAAFVVFVSCVHYATLGADRGETSELMEADRACLRTGALASDLDLVVRDAVAVLRQSGHDPRDYRVQLRVEDALQPDFPRLGSGRAASVVFVPRAGTDRYPLRVHVTHPCVVGWIWRPVDFTPWQRDVIERVSTLSPRLALNGASEIRVTETEWQVRVQVGRRTGVNGQPIRDELSVTLEKAGR